ncbi:MAG: type IV toxin-antitoxin system AbiEi family antitoxin domain-containing protein [Candidatus Micrarchaeia archaeon]|jgi:predicted transcriptional regulator of viral defense system
MQTKEFIKFLASRNITVFTLDDATKILDSGKMYASLFLQRAVGKNVIGRVERGLYYIKSKANEYEIASNVLKPSYVSMVSALAYYGLTTQIPRFIYVVSTKRHKPIKGINGYDIIFKHVKQDMMFGYHKEANGNVYIADPEKAIVDIYYFADVNDLDEDALDRPPRVNIAKLARYAEASKNKRVLLGVAKLLKEHRYYAYADKLLSSATS